MGTRIKGLLASLLILVLLVGVPIGLLVAGGTPWPHSLPSWDDITGALTAPDDGSAFLAVLKVVGWLAWLSFAAMLVVEIVARLRGVRPPRIPGLGLQQRTAAGLVTAAALLFAVAAPMFTSGASAADGGGTPATSSMSQSIGGHDQVRSDAGPQAARDAAPAGTAAVRPATPAGGVHQSGGDHDGTREYVVQQGDSLYSIAEQTLGSGDRFAEIAELNYGVTQADGGELNGGHWLHAGWKIRVPVVKAAVRPGGADVTVKTGDTLSEIAQRELGDAGKYQEIFDASKSLDQPGGAHLTDPDQIQPGWQLAVPPPPPPAPADLGDGGVQPGAPAGSGDAQPGPGSRGGHAGDAGPDAPATPAPDQPAPDQPAPDQPAPEQPTPDQPAPEQPAPEQPTPDQPTPEQPAPDQPVPDQPAEQPTPDQPNPDQPTPGQPVPDRPDAPADNPADNSADEQPPASDAAVRPADADHEQPPAAHDQMSESGLPAAGVIVGIVLAAGLRRRRRTPVSAEQYPARPGADDDLVSLVDRSLRTLAHSCAEESRPLPIVRVARLSGHKLELYLDQPAELPTPWTGVSGGTVWSSTLADEGLLTPMVATAIVPPYPSLVTLGHDHEGAAILVDLAFVGALGVVGDRATADGVLAALAAELAVAPWSQGLEVTVLGGLTDLAVTAGPPLRHRATTVQARAEMLSGEPQVLLVAGSPTRDQLADLAGLAEATPGVGLVAPSDVVGRWALTLDPGGWAMLQPLGLPLRPQSLSPDDYQGLGPEPAQAAP